MIAICLAPVLAGFAFVVGAQLVRRQPVPLDSGGTAFPLAAMDAANFIISLVITPLLSLVWMFAAPILAYVWLYMRPQRFEVSPSDLRIVWPLRGSRVIPWNRVTGVERTDRRTLGWGRRLGSGGFGGTFGQLMTRACTYTIYASRFYYLVVVHVAGDRPLLISPADREGFIRQLEAFRGVTSP